MDLLLLKSLRLSLSENAILLPSFLMDLRLVWNSRLADTSCWQIKDLNITVFHSSFLLRSQSLLL